MEKITLSLETKEDRIAINKILNIVLFYAEHFKDGHCIWNYLIKNGYTEILLDYFRKFKEEKKEYLLFKAIEEDNVALTKVFIDIFFEDKNYKILFEAYKRARRLKRNNIILLFKEKIIV